MPMNLSLIKHLASRKPKSKLASLKGRSH